jgi:glycosyltransferase involved in cell wall biosynthesis
MQINSDVQVAKIRMKILHVSDSYNAGVKHGIENLISQYPEHEHYLLWASHSDSPIPTSQDLNQYFTDSIEWKGGVTGKYKQLAKVTRNLSPNILHLHSSVAGVLGRILISRVPKMYSPHCFAFQRTDISILKKTLFLAAEFILSLRGDYFAMCWPIEIELAKRYFKKSRFYFMPIVDLHELRHAKFNFDNKTGTIVSVGRIRPQKDPNFLVKAIDYEPSLQSSVSWIGSGDKELTYLLENRGLVITPWMESKSIWRSDKGVIASCITSSWESGPLTLIESLSAGVPVICRSIAAIDLYGFATYSSPSAFSSALKEALTSEAFRIELFNQQKELVLAKFEGLGKSYSTNDPYIEIAKIYE